MGSPYLSVILHRRRPPTASLVGQVHTVDALLQPQARNHAQARVAHDFTIIDGPVSDARLSGQLTPRCGDKPPENSRTFKTRRRRRPPERHTGYTFPRVAAGALASVTRGMMRRIRGIAGGRLGLRMSQPRPKLSGVNWLSRRPADASQPTQPAPAHLSCPSG